MRAGEVSRRSFFRQAGSLGLDAALAELPAVLKARGLRGASDQVTNDTFAALAAFVLPGDDAYSLAQEQTFPGPGAVAAGTGTTLVESLDAYQEPAGRRALRASAGLAALLNHLASVVAPRAKRGDFASPFARLSHAEKAAVFRCFESDRALAATEVRFVGRILPGLTAFVAFSAEEGVYDREQRAFAGRAVGLGEPRLGALAPPAVGKRSV
jgi:hypothetical protein